MRGITLVICTVAVTFGALCESHTAGAATISSITSDITGGDFANLGGQHGQHRRASIGRKAVAFERLERG